MFFFVFFCNVPIHQFSAISWREQVNFQWHDDEIHFVLDQHAELNFHSASSLKRQFAGLDMSLHSDTLFWFRANQSLLFLLGVASLAEKQQPSDHTIKLSIRFWYDIFFYKYLTIIRSFKASRGMNTPEIWLYSHFSPFPYQEKEMAI
jgi:hypothetical protein